MYRWWYNIKNSNRGHMFYTNCLGENKTGGTHHLPLNYLNSLSFKEYNGSITNVSSLEILKKYK